MGRGVPHAPSAPIKTAAKLRSLIEVLPLMEPMLPCFALKVPPSEAGLTDQSYKEPTLGGRGIRKRAVFTARLTRQPRSRTFPAERVFEIIRRSGRVVEGSGFENRRTERYQGFESLLLRRVPAKKLASHVSRTRSGCGCPPPTTSEYKASCRCSDR
jgi:hypothetical protein